MRVNLSLMLVLCFACAAYSQQDVRKPVGKIIRIKGKAYLKDEGQTQRVLTSRENGLRLFPEQVLVCGATCEVTFTIGLTFQKLTQGRYPIPNLIRPPMRLTSIRAAGSKRGEGAILLSPVEHGNGLVRPDSFKFRWRMLKINDEPVSVAPLTISLNDCKTDERIWSETSIDYAPGFYVVDLVKESLKQKQQRNSVVSAEVVVASASFDKKQRYCFDIIPASEEQQLRNELSKLDGYSELMRHATRAYVFYQHRLYSEAVDEFDMALQLSPDIDYLLADAIKAHFQLGDEEGVKGLLGRLQRVSPASELYREMLTLTGQRKKE